jgi:hypothetical protein
MGNKNTAQSGLPRPQEYHQEHMLETFIIRDSKVCHREIREPVSLSTRIPHGTAAATDRGS